MLVKIDVTQEDIDNGQQFNCLECPVALALARACPLEKGVWRIGVHMLYASAVKDYAPGAYKSAVSDYERGVYKSQHRLVQALTNLPLIAQAFIRWFDCGSPVEPFQFELEIKEEALADFR
jgi:hypothetical protein